MEQKASRNIHDLVVDGNNRVYVLDVGLKEVRVFDADGFLKSVATEGDGSGRMALWTAVRIRDFESEISCGRSPAASGLATASSG